MPMREASWVSSTLNILKTAETLSDHIEPLNLENISLHDHLRLRRLTVSS